MCLLVVCGPSGLSDPISLPAGCLGNILSSLLSAGQTGASWPHIVGTSCYWLEHPAWLVYCLFHPTLPCLLINKSHIMVTTKCTKCSSHFTSLRCLLNTKKRHKAIPWLAFLLLSTTNIKYFDSEKYLHTYMVMNLFCGETIFALLMI